MAASDFAPGGFLKIPKFSEALESSRGLSGALGSSRVLLGALGDFRVLLGTPRSFREISGAPGSSPELFGGSRKLSDALEGFPQDSVALGRFRGTQRFGEVWGALGGSRLSTCARKH